MPPVPVFAAAAVLTVLATCAMLAVRARQRRNRTRQVGPNTAEGASQEASDDARPRYTASPATSQPRYPDAYGEVAEGGHAPPAAEKIHSAQQLVPNATADASSEQMAGPVRQPDGAEAGDSRAAAKSAEPESAQYERILEAELLAGQQAAKPAGTAAAPEPQNSGPPAVGGLEARTQAEADAHIAAGVPVGQVELGPSSPTGAGGEIPPPERYSDEDPSAASEAKPEASEPTERLPAAAPPPRRPYRPVAPSARRPRRGPPAATELANADRPLPICVRLVFERAGFCRVSLLARRGPGLPEEVPIDGTGNPVKLAALQEDWYQDVLLDGLGQALRTGISWQPRAGSGERTRWTLSGREIVVLAPHEDLSGFVSCARLVVGEKHVVLCTQSQLAPTLEAIALAGSPKPVELEAEMGVPDGWVGLRGVVPRNAVAPSGGEILDVLRPLAEAEIALDGGIRLSRSTWLAGHPPQIRLRGDAAAAGTLYIDDHAAIPDTDSTYRVPNWDSPGEHLIRCASGGTRTYHIAAGSETWEAWDAYTWSAGGVDSSDPRKPSICGALVLAPRAQRCGQRMLSVPAPNPVLVGARPGDIYKSERRSDVRTDELAVFAPFAAVWALPADVFHCSRQSRILSIQAAPPVPPPTRIRASETQRLLAWCSAILDASRKRLAIQPDDQAIRKLWADYRCMAHALRKRLR